MKPRHEAVWLSPDYRACAPHDIGFPQFTELPDKKAAVAISL